MRSLPQGEYSCWRKEANYEKNHFVGERNGDNEDYKNFIENLIHNKLSEYHRSDYELWQMYFENAVK